ncbi:MAG TPA: adenosylmethionine-8-amino-7-oxononanoate aminotransferase [Planctomycetaceae bacterium]|nr:adenosylmethionine-8-amino-7-oxononanoate aminotransferase [Planctomycetaceae bacterium]
MAGKLTGKVVEVDSTGSLVTDISPADLGDAPRDASLRILVDEHETYGLFEGEHSQPEMTLVAILDDGQIKISLVGDSASAMLGVQIGAPVEVNW